MMNSNSEKAHTEENKPEKVKTYTLFEKKRHMEEQYHALNQKQRHVLSIKGARAWMLQGQQLVGPEKLTPANFLQITSYLTKLPDDDTKLVFSVVNLKLFLDMTEDIGKGFFGFFKLENMIKSERKVAKERCERRLISLEPPDSKVACTQQLNLNVTRMS